MMTELQWQWSTFHELSVLDLYLIIAAREEVFCVGQGINYQDCDGLDPYAWHLVGWKHSNGQRSVAAYCRVIAPGYKYDEPAIGRVLTTPQFRGTGVGKTLMKRALENTSRVFPGQPIHISAQQYLCDFYSGFGFEQVSEPYMEEGISHIKMVRIGSA